MKRPDRPRPPPPGVLFKNARTETIRKLVARITAERGGIAPSDAELGALLAISAKMVRRHRAILRM